MKIQHSSRRMPRRFLTFAIALLLFGGATFRPTQAGQTASAAENDPAKEEATAAMEKWLALIDTGKYGESWDASSAFFKANVTRDFWISSLQSVRAPLGKLESRTLSSALHQQNIPQPNGTMKKVDAVIAQFETSFDNLDAARETVTFEREKDGSWRASGYYIKPM